MKAEAPTPRARDILEAQVNKLRGRLQRKQADVRSGGREDVDATLDVLHTQDRTDAIWYLRNREQNSQQSKRDEFVKGYRPLRSFSYDPLQRGWDHRKAMDAYSMATRRTR